MLLVNPPLSILGALCPVIHQANSWLMRVMALAGSNTPASSRSGFPAFEFGIIAVAAAMIGLGVAYALDYAGRTEGAPPRLDDPAVAVQKTLGGRELSIPPSWIRIGSGDANRFVSEIDLVLALDFEPAPALVHVTLQPRSRARPSALLLDTVYLHRFGGDTLSGPTGLVGKTLGQGEGFGGETVWYDALSPNPFVAKCLAPVVAEAPSRCMRTVVLASGIAATYAFDAEILPHWRAFDAAAAPWLERIGAL